MRSKLGFDDIIPRGTGEEKIVCLQNNYEVGTFNGAFLTLTDRFDVDDETVSYEVSSEDCAISGRHMFLRACFEQSAVPENHQDRETIKAAWAYALTAHKAQGSEWGNVVVIDDRWRRKVEEDRRRWLYTAITRASKNLVIAG